MLGCRAVASRRPTRKEAAICAVPPSPIRLHLHWSLEANQSVILIIARLLDAPVTIGYAQVCIRRPSPVDALLASVQDTPLVSSKCPLQMYPQWTDRPAARKTNKTFQNTAAGAVATLDCSFRKLTRFRGYSRTHTPTNRPAAQASTHTRARGLSLVL